MKVPVQVRKIRQESPKYDCLLFAMVLDQPVTVPPMESQMQKPPFAIHSVLAWPFPGPLL